MKPIYWLKKPVLDSCWLDHWKWLMPDLLRVVLEFLSNGEGLDRFLQHVLLKLGKITVACPKWKKGPSRVNFDLPKVSKIHIYFELVKVSKMTKMIQRVPLDTPPQAVVMSSPDKSLYLELLKSCRYQI